MNYYSSISKYNLKLIIKVELKNLLNGINVLLNNLVKIFIK